MPTYKFKDLRKFYPRWKRIRLFFGMSGIDRKETALTRQIGSSFEWLMLLILIWLPFQWHLDYYHTLNPTAVDITNWIIWFAFVLESSVMVCLAEKKLYYLSTNWMNILIILIGMPLLWSYFPLLASLRGFRFLLLAIALLVPWFPIAFDVLTQNRLGTTLIVFFIVTTLSGIAMSFVEKSFHNPFNGIWFAWETVTSVGYGDFYPSTPVGKLVSIIIMLMGACLFSLLTANFSAYLIKRQQQKNEEEKQEETENTLIELKDIITELNERIKNLEEKK